ncbi:hypothetical protein [Paraburkholderia sp. J41]|uniref:hypothetical protein n=1 Tax=Paraburkholderia sp. J41 TaxID=2805433 RepID=UPI002AC36957|nr:hypothetical protein [Paraburkholderia sp. J41]
MAQHSDQDYVQFDPFQGDEADIRLRRVRLVRVRKPHQCHVGPMLYGESHEIQPGERARYEKALIDHSFWGRYYACLPCLDKWLSDIYGDTNENAD